MLNALPFEAVQIFNTKIPAMAKRIPGLVFLLKYIRPTAG